MSWQQIESKQRPGGREPAKRLIHQLDALGSPTTWESVVHFVQKEER
jgi:hypothetical protein